MFILHSAPKLSFVGKDAQDHAVKISKLFDVAAIFMRCFQAIHRVRNEKIDCHRFSGMATQCVELLGTDIIGIYREAPSLSFLQENNKTLKIRGGAYEVLYKLFYFRVTFDARDTVLLSRMHSIVLS